MEKYSKEILEKKVRERAVKVLKNYKDEFSHICKKLNITENNIIDTVVVYDVYSEKLDNSAYSSHLMRAVLRTLYLAEGTYHKERAQAVVDFLRTINFKSICEVGFGIPTQWVFDYVLTGNAKGTLIDMDTTAQEFSEALLGYYDLENKRKEFLKYKIMDMDTLEYPGDYDVYVMMDSIEHTKNPTAYLNVLTTKSQKNSHFLFSIPIGPLSDFNKQFHYAEWLTNKEAIKWLNDSGLDVVQQKEVCPNPKIDFFIHSLDVPFHNLLAHCKLRAGM